MPIDYTQFVGLDQSSADPQETYLNEIDAKDILRDPRFIADIHTYYGAKGESFDTDEDAIRHWYNDRTWGNLNTLGIADDLIDVATESQEMKAIASRLQRAYTDSPFFWQDGGMGDVSGAEVAKSIGGALIADPLNLIPGAKAVQAGGQAMRQAAKAGTSTTMAGIGAGAKAGALAEAAISAGTEAVHSVGTQARDVELGLQDGISAAQVGIDAGAGAVLGGGIGGVIGGAAGGMLGKGAALKSQQADADLINQGAQHLRDEYGFSKVESVGVGDDLAGNEQLLAQGEAGLSAAQAEIQARSTPEAPAATDAEEGAIPTEFGGQPIDVELARANFAARNQEYQDAIDSGAPEETLKELKAEAYEASRLVALGDAIKEAQGRLYAMAGSSADKERSKAAQELMALQRDLHIYQRLLSDDGPDAPLDEIENAIKRTQERVDNAAGEPQATTPEGTPDQPASKADEAPATPEEGQGEEALQEEKPLEAINYEEAIEVDGKMTKETINAKEMYDVVTSRFEALYQLRTCLGG